MSKYDTIEVVEKGVDEIVEVEKFNPFHDGRGRFSNKNGFASYSANPNTKAGAMAIARSAAAGHGTTRNVHREATSTGPTIRHNANWLGSGHQLNSRWQGSGTLRNRVEPIGGLQGASATGASWQYQNAQQGRTTKPAPAKQPQTQQNQQAQQKPAPTKQTQAQTQQQKPAQQQQQAQQQDTTNTSQSLKAQVAGVHLGAGDKLAIQARDDNGHTTLTKNVAKNHYQDRVAGKDISGTVDVTKIKGNADPIDKIAKAQGWNKAPTVTDDLETFQKAAKQSGCVMLRSVSGNTRTGESADAICAKTMTDANAALGGGGGKWYGAGLYVVKTDFGNATGRNLSKKIAEGQHESYFYGNKQMMATVHPNAKIATPKQATKLQDEYYRLSPSTQRKYGGYGEYIASKGYDGAQWQDSSDPKAYATIYNKSAMIFYSGVAQGF